MEQPQQEPAANLSDGPDQVGPSAPRRTALAAERTWLAWWRTGLAASAVALAVGRFLPGLSKGPHWPARVLGIGYGLLAIAIFVLGARRQLRAVEALRRGEFDELPPRLVIALTAAGVLLAVATLLVVSITF
jgi:uncharacterized membrane protein YidH (DUF202 family)